MNCENCSWYVDREKTTQESQFARQNPMMMIDTRFCTLGGCDGSMFIDKNRQAEKESRNDQRRKHKSKT